MGGSAQEELYEEVEDPDPDQDEQAPPRAPGPAHVAAPRARRHRRRDPDLGAHRDLGPPPALLRLTSEAAATETAFTPDELGMVMTSRSRAGASGPPDCGPADRTSAGRAR